MRKILLLTPLAFLSLAHAETTDMDTDMCIQMTQAAVSPAGECQEFSTPCEVPEDYKKVPSCDAVQSKSFGTSLEERMKKRFAHRQKNNGTRQKSTIRGFGQSAGAGVARPRTTRSTSDTAQTGVRKMSTRKNYSSAARNWAKQFYKNRGGYQQPDDTTKEERAERRSSSATRKIRSSVTKNLRKKLSNKPTWSAETSQRSRTLDASKNWENTHLSEERRKMRTSRQQRIYDGIQLRKTWKGGRIDGNLDGSATTTDTDTEETTEE